MKNRLFILLSTCICILQLNAQESNDSASFESESAQEITVTATEQPSIQNNKGEVYFSFWGNLKYRSDKTKVKNEEVLFYDLPEAAKIYRTGKTWRVVGGGIMGAGIGMMIVDICCHYHINYNPIACPVFWVGAGMVVISPIFSQVGWSKQKTAINIYNAAILRQQTTNISLNFGIMQSGGIGLAVNF